MLKEKWWQCQWKTHFLISQYQVSLFFNALWIPPTFPSLPSCLKPDMFLLRKNWVRNEHLLISSQVKALGHFSVTGKNIKYVTILIFILLFKIFSHSLSVHLELDFTVWSEGFQVVKNPPASAGDRRDVGWGGKIPRIRKWQPTPVF